MSVTELSKTCSIGTVYYRMPNVIERMRLLGQLGLTTRGITIDNEFTFLSQLMERLQPFIIRIDAEKDGQRVDTWDEALNHSEMVTPIGDIASDMLNFLIDPASWGADGKKKEDEPTVKKPGKKKKRTTRLSSAR